MSLRCYNLAEIEPMFLKGLVHQAATPWKDSSEQTATFAPAREGERNNRLTKIAGKLLAHNMTLDETVDIAGLWNEQNPDPLDRDELERTCASIQATHLRNHSGSAFQEQYAAEPLFDLQTAKVGRFIDATPPERRWLLKDTLPLGKVGALVARGGTGKSQFLLQMAISVATGVKLAGRWEIGEPGAAMVLFSEDDDEEIHRRVRTCADFMAGDTRDQAKFFQDLKDNLFIKSMVAQPNLMTAKLKSGEVVATDYVSRLLLTLRGVPELKLVIIDPASRFRGGEENSAGDVTRFVEELEKIPRAVGATLLVAHHVRKSSSSSADQAQDAARGSSALSDGVRWQMNITSFDASRGSKYAIPSGQHRNYLTVDITKNNYAAPQEEVILKRGDGGYLSCVEIQTAKIAKASTSLEQVIALVVSEEVAGLKYSQAAFEKKFGGVDTTLGISHLEIRKLLKDAIEKGRLTYVNRELRAPTRVLRAKLSTTEPNA
jgi:RecA-family ATPase